MPLKKDKQWTTLFMESAKNRLQKLYAHDHLNGLNII